MTHVRTQRRVGQITGVTVALAAFLGYLITHQWWIVIPIILIAVPASLYASRAAR